MYPDKQTVLNYIDIEVCYIHSLKKKKHNFYSSEKSLNTFSNHISKCEKKKNSHENIFVYIGRMSDI